ncbi:MAG: VanW family protein [Clostridia bacterium]|nr:VanW family protein [Clostridia bacterium]
MERTPGTGRQPIYNGDGETVRAPHRRADRHAQVTQAGQPGRQPLGRTGELKEKQQYQAFHQPTWTVEGPEEIKQRNRDRRKKKSRLRGLWITVICLCLVCIAALGVLAAPMLLGVQYAALPNFAFVNGSIVRLDFTDYANYRTFRQYMASDTIYPGMYVDGVDVGGMTVEEAILAVSQVSATDGASFQININVGDNAWVIDSAQVPMTRNVEEMVNLAYAYGRSNTASIRGTKITPFQERLNAAMDLRMNPVNLTTGLTYDRESIRQMTDQIAAYVSREPVNASVASFNFNTRSFTFSADQAGTYLDPDVLYDRVIACIDGGNYYATLTVTPEPLLAEVTKAELMNSFRMVASYTTETTSNANRNTNVQLSAAAINGRTVLPGEIFSFNAATGQRTAEKGYKEATAISGGQNVPEIGGGVCQTSSTLFNAVARANLEIINRSPHAWPSSYVEKGMDATVNWPNLDFKFRNNTDWPVFIIASYANRKVTVELYGCGLGDGVTIDLESKVLKTLNPPDEIKYVQNPNLPAGTKKNTVKARTGYVVETYKVWYQNGKEFKRETLFTSTYKAYQETVEYN